MSAVTSAVSSIASTALQSLTGVSSASARAFTPAASASAAPAAPFSSLLSDTVGQMDKLDTEARQAADGLITGAGVDVHQAMIAAQKSEMSFEMALAVRNKAVQAYQQVMSMQF